MQATDYVRKILPSTKMLDMDIRPGDTIRVHQRIQEGSRERVAVFEGLVISRRHGREPGASITVRRITKGIGVERVFPLAMPTLEKIEIVRRAKVRRAKLNYLRNLIGKKATLKGELLPPGFGQPAEQDVEPVDAMPEEVSDDEAVEKKTQESSAEEKKDDASEEGESVQPGNEENKGD